MFISEQAGGHPRGFVGRDLFIAGDLPRTQFSVKGHLLFQILRVPPREDQMAKPVCKVPYLHVVRLSASGLLKDAPDRYRDLVIAVDFSSEVLAARGGRFVIAGAAILGGFAPLGGEPSFG